MNDTEKRLVEAERKIDELTKSINALKIDNQLSVKRATKLHPGVATKVEFSADGVIIGTEELQPSDIPSLPINKINDLEQRLSRLLTIKQMETFFNHQIDDIGPSKPVATGTKISIDKHGYVSSIGPLKEEDIPDLPIGKIIGLSDQLQLLDKPQTTPKEYTIQASSNPYIEYDNHGRVVSSRPLTDEDLPRTLMNRLNEIESTLTTKANQQDLSTVKTQLSTKADKFEIPDGTYTKFQVSNGSIVNPSTLNENDIPSNLIDQLEDMNSSNSSSVSHSEFVELQNQVAIMVSRMKTMEQLNDLLTQLALKADKESVSRLETKINELNTKLNGVSKDNAIVEQLVQISSEISALSGRIALLETKPLGNY